MSRKPPNWPIKLLRFTLKDELAEEIEGDLLEFYKEWVEKYSTKKANRRYVFHAIKFIRPYALKHFYIKSNHSTMLRNYITIAWRQIQTQRIFSFIKIGGFSLAIACCILIILYVAHQTRFDKHYEKKERIFRIVNQWSDAEVTGFWTNVHGPLKEILEDNVPEIEKSARVVLWSWGDGGDNHVKVAGTTQNFYEEGFIYADPELLNILEIPMVYGSQEQALSEPNTLVLSESKANKYFPGQDPVGKQIILNNNPETTYTIGGVMKDFPVNVHLQSAFILTLQGRKSGPGTSGWCCTNYNMYVQLSENVNKAVVEEKTRTVRNSLVLDKLRESGASGLDEMEKYQSYYLQSVQDIYLNPEQVGDDLKHGSIELIRIFSISAIIVLVLASINFINLSTANAISRAKEVGVRKAIGSSYRGLVNQYLTESWVNTLIAMALGIGIATLILPLFNRFAGVLLAIPWKTIWFIPALFGSSIVIGFLAGLYPAYYLSAFRPVEVLKGKVVLPGSNSFLRNATLVFQFSMTAILIISALVAYKQFDFLMNKPLGFEKEQVINILGLETMDSNTRESFKAELKNLSVVEDASSSDFIPVEGGAIQNRSFWLAERRQLDNGFEAAYWWVDEDYIPTMQMTLINGRNFNEQGDDKSIIINESMAQALGIADPIGVQVMDMFEIKYTVIGIIKDFHFESLLGELRPLAMVKGSGKSMISVRVSGDRIEEGVDSIESLWVEFQPNQSMRYQFMDQRFKSMYEDLKRTETIFILFSVLSVVIACSGLFALSMYMIGRRRKEISIHKVLGASESRIISLLSMDYIRLILVSIMIAFPIAWYTLEHILLEDFTNRIDLSWGFFAIAGLFVLIMALGTVSYETIKATFINPAETLKDE